MRVARGRILMAGIVLSVTTDSASVAQRSAWRISPFSYASIDSLPSFTRVISLETTSETSANVSIGDVNGDGHLDVVLVKGRHWPLVDRVLLGDGTGRFTRSYDLGTRADRSYSGRLADLDRDGDLDVVISNDAPDPKLVYLNDGKGHFSAGSQFGRPEWPTPHRDAGQSRIYLAGPQGRFAPSRTIPFGPSDASIRMTEAADMNGDGRLDIVAIDERAGTAVYFGDASGGYGDRVTVAGATPTPYALAVADVNADAKPDVIVGNIEAPSAIYVNDGTGRRFRVTSCGDNKGAAYGFAVADLNGDGRVDVAVARSDAPNIVCFASSPPK